MDTFIESGVIDFDKLNTLERDQYLKALEAVATATVTLEDWKSYITQMRQAVEASLVDEPHYIYSDWIPFLKRTNPKFVELKMRLKNYLIFERFFTRADGAKKALEEYNKKLGVK